MSGSDTAIRLLFLAAASCFVLGLHLMNSPATARRGNQLSAAGMVAAVGTAVGLLARDGVITATGLIVLIAGVLLGSGAGLYAARTVRMTAMPQLVSVFNAVGGGAAALVAFAEVARLGGAAGLAGASGQTTVTVGLDVVIGAVTFSGSLVAAGKLQGLISGAPVLFRGARLLNAALAAVAVTGVAAIVAGHGGTIALSIVAAAALGLGVTMVLPIGGADMPVVISLLNAFTGTAVAMAGFVLDSTVLVIAGALVGASGSILTVLMAEAMNRSIPAIIVGGFGTADSTGNAGAAASAPVRSVAADDAALQLAYASKVIIVPGYGLAAARAQHEVVELADLLTQHGVDVCYAIHPVAGRMPGHMNVLLAEAHVPYPQMKELAEVNPEFAQADVALVVGANDVTNPAARRPGNAISGMPILDVDQAKSVIVIKRSMGHGYAGIDNELYTDPKTGMLFNDAKAGLSALTAAMKTLVH
ncbi:NAD/NADP transhydrogenase beta subunit [Frankia casuarinae]|uniref:NAD(P) transhydrogenase subunit beta n=1 Tax=Frankia casuarinae (strain DSM 45818 / CECT 9043 / HFP020203 / CcI3) TaxID=106370 RepID=Q2J8T6_FRACC|nr:MULTISPECIES: NAD(P)(+) transhydrogenase (Re/Si-specific) subunit beta [Frankia]ABD12306.1 NAD(P) transhydrogenase, beta subunit [Frankia casuarinae]ETA01109.1 NAD/NADP transhydrogenase beta subunit [Frankia sp. CcI6]EYT90917.1 NAD/NADP transhydrogenase beta subunit [Frankia casuarinae]KFB03160.1 NAD/NADP transhydrogenase beta subunit [Frankia sp. Allo2]OAA20747.1 NAD(P) transhydrogenase subunit beta [Frankia casuarinae]